MIEYASAPQLFVFFVSRSAWVLLQLCDPHTQLHAKHGQSFLTDVVPPSEVSYMDTQIIVRFSLTGRGKIVKLL